MAAKGWKPIQLQFHTACSPHTSPSTPRPLFLPHLCLGEQTNFPVLGKTEAHCQGSISTVRTPPTPRHGPGTGRMGSRVGGESASRHHRAAPPAPGALPWAGKFGGYQAPPWPWTLLAASVPVETGAWVTK